jgi:hypothetical protein
MTKSLCQQMSTTKWWRLCFTFQVVQWWIFLCWTFFKWARCMLLDHLDGWFHQFICIAYETKNSAILRQIILIKLSLIGHQVSQIWLYHMCKFDVLGMTFCMTLYGLENLWELTHGNQLARACYYLDTSYSAEVREWLTS